MSKSCLWASAVGGKPPRGSSVSPGGMPRPVPAVRLVSMTDGERDAALEGQAADYADAKARAGVWTREESLRRSREEIRRLVGTRPSERGHEFFVGQDAGGRRIGWIWIGPVPSPAEEPATRWLFQITVEPGVRGQGFGRGLLRAAEDHVRSTGRSRLALNVFRWNTVAVRLYESSGYRIAFQDDRGLEMRKWLGSE